MVALARVRPGRVLFSKTRCATPACREVSEASRAARTSQSCPPISCNLTHTSLRRNGFSWCSSCSKSLTSRIMAYNCCDGVIRGLLLTDLAIRESESANHGKRRLCVLHWLFFTDTRQALEN